MIFRPRYLPGLPPDPPVYIPVTGVLVCPRSVCRRVEVQVSGVVKKSVSLTFLPLSNPGNTKNRLQ